MNKKFFILRKEKKYLENSWSWDGCFNTLEEAVSVATNRAVVFPKYEYVVTEAKNLIQNVTTVVNDVSNRSL